MRLSLLDRSRTRSGEPDATGLTSTIERGVAVEALGYERFWVAEHHGVPGIASGSPPVLLAALAMRTHRIRLGSGGVMLPHHQPLVVAEQFRMLDALAPGRIDLGLGRSLGFTAPVRDALRDVPEAVDRFADDVAAVLAHLGDTATVTARPRTPGPVEVALLATGRGVALAGWLGLPVVVGGPVLAQPAVEEMLTQYRRAGGPRVTISLDVTVADDDAAARELALPEVWAMARSRETGEFGPLESVESIRGQSWSRQTRERVQRGLDAAVAGSPVTVRERLEDLRRRTGADELLASSSTYDRAALARSDALLRDLLR